MTEGRRRAYGQHFLKDRSIAEAIARAAVEEGKKAHCGSFLEIGPGRGAITEPLIHMLDGSPLILVEKDRALAEHWRANAASEVFSSDFLELSDEKWLKKPPVAVVSNLPYSSGTQILIQLARRFQGIPVMVLMFQAEVARRVRAEPSTPDRGSLSLWIQNRWDVRKLITVKPSAFSPPPKVLSEVIVLHRRSESRIEIGDAEFEVEGKQIDEEVLWEKVLKAAFAHRRKMLRSSFPWQNALALSGVDGKKRAEALDWTEWSQLFQAVKAVIKQS
ncbi:MAG: ribosomal RNA small subunit methyltransferase A [Bdellovibrio sp.]|nr:ribosomal RNA small subunit methyltransferase A [Bdellovibrio sp.]